MFHEYHLNYKALKYFSKLILHHNWYNFLYIHKIHLNHCYRLNIGSLFLMLQNFFF